MGRFMNGLAGAMMLGAVTLNAPAARAELDEVNIATQFGISYLGFMIMEHDKLLEKQAREAGLGDITVNWSNLAGGAAMNDALLSGSLHIASGGIGPFLVLWSKLVGTPNEVVAVSARSSSVGFLNTRNPNVKEVKDFSDADRIALAAVGVSSVAVALQMAAEEAFGQGNHDKLDAITVTMSPPDGLAAVLSGQSEVNSAFTFPPYHQEMLKDPAVHNVTSTAEIVGEGTTLDLIYTTQKFRKENPKLYEAFVKSYIEAVESIEKDKDRAADIYLKLSGFRGAKDVVLEQLNDPTLAYTATPKNNMKFAEFMYKTGKIEKKPSDWKELFAEEVHHLPGS